MCRNRLTLDQPAAYEISIPGKLNINWQDWHEGITVRVENVEGYYWVTTLRITIDQAGLQGLLQMIYSKGLPLISAVWVDYQE